MKNTLSGLIKIIVALFFSFGLAHGSSKKTTPEDARTQLVTMAETGAAKADIARVRALIDSYRVDEKDAYLPLRSAPYPRFLINAQLAEIYPALYHSEFEKFINHIPLELLFDGILDIVAKKQIPDDLKDSLKGLDARMARRAQKGKSESCKLDESEDVVKVRKGKLFSLKIDIPKFVSACVYRQRLFNAAKPALLVAREDEATKAKVREAAKDKFPEEFRKGFIKQIDETIKTFPELVSQKFGGGTTGEDVHPIWSERGGIIESSAMSMGKNGRRIIHMKSFAQGLLADLYAANVLMGSKVPRDRSLAAGLFYAVVNRWLFLTGGIEADWDREKFEMPVAEMGTGMKPPKFRETAFGGWGAESTGFGVAMSAWDWGKYKPSDAKNPSALRIFPTAFEVDLNGVALAPDPSEAYQTNDDLAYMLLAVTEFLKSTQPKKPLAQFFGGRDKIADLLDATKPMLFPTEGRMIAVGVLAAIAQNLLHPDIGHVASKRDGIPIYFRDHGSFGSIQETDIDTRGVCSLLVAATKLTKALKGDPILKKVPDLKAILPQISQLVQVSALVVGKEQGFDGSIPALMVSSDKTTSLGAQIAAVRVFLAAFNGSESPENATFVMARLVPAITYLFTNQIGQPQKLNLEARLNILAVWKEAQAALRKVRTDLPWDAWEAAIRKISSR